MSSSDTPREGTALPYGVPEDPPVYNDDDALGCINDALREQPKQKAKKRGSDSDEEDLAKKVGAEPVPGIYGDDGFAGNDPVPVEYGSPLEASIARVEEERRRRVWKRRHPSNPILKVFQAIVPYGGIVGTAFNLASSTIGAGIISLPSAFHISGIGMSCVYLAVVATLAVYSFSLLAIVSKKTGLCNWEIMCRQLLGPGADYFLAFVMWCLCFGGDVSYVLSLGRVLKGFLINSPSTSEFFKSKNGINVITVIVWACIMLPLSLPKEINSLRVVSTIAILFIVFFVVCMVVHSSQTLHREGMRDDLVYFQTGNLAIQGLSIYMYAYICQVNALESLSEMYKPSLFRFTLAALLGIGLCFVLYLFAGLFGYLEFGTTLGDTVLDNYNPIKDKLMAVSYAGIMLKLCVGFALHMIPCRDAIYHVAGTNVERVPWWLNACVCGVQAAVALVAGLYIPRITTVFSLLGGFCGGFIGFVFPALFMIYAGNFTPRGVGWGHFICSYGLLLVGVIAVTWGTSAAIYAEVVSA